MIGAWLTGVVTLAALAMLAWLWWSSRVCDCGRRRGSCDGSCLLCWRRPTDSPGVLASLRPAPFGCRHAPSAASAASAGDAVPVRLVDEEIAEARREFLLARAGLERVQRERDELRLELEQWRLRAEAWRVHGEVRVIERDLALRALLGDSMGAQLPYAPVAEPMELVKAVRRHNAMRAM